MSRLILIGLLQKSLDTVYVTVRYKSLRAPHTIFEFGTQDRI